MTETPSSEYRAGECNIGDRERQRRRRWAIVSAGIGIVYVGAIVLSESPTFLIAGLFVPASLAFEWIFEARRSFCVRLAVAGRYHFGEEDGRVPADARATDVRTAGLITAVAVLCGAAVTSLTYVAFAAW